MVNTLMTGTTKEELKREEEGEMEEGGGDGAVDRVALISPPTPT